MNNASLFESFVKDITGDDIQLFEAIMEGFNTLLEYGNADFHRFLKNHPGVFDPKKQDEVLARIRQGDARPEQPKREQFARRPRNELTSNPVKIVLAYGKDQMERGNLKFYASPEFAQAYNNAVRMIQTRPEYRDCKIARMDQTLLDKSLAERERLKNTPGMRLKDTPVTLSSILMTTPTVFRKIPREIFEEDLELMPNLPSAV